LTKPPDPWDALVDAVAERVMEKMRGTIPVDDTQRHTTRERVIRKVDDPVYIGPRGTPCS
jgi:hypothetical protein